MTAAAQKPRLPDEKNHSESGITPAKRYVAFLENISPDTVAGLRQHVAPDVHFRDPFNDVRGRERMAVIFEDMFRHLKDISFKVDTLLEQDGVCMISWVMTGQPVGAGRVLGRSWRAEGMTRIEVKADGLISAHIDHWDASTQFYDRFPVVGGMLRHLRRRIGHG